MIRPEYMGLHTLAEKVDELYLLPRRGYLSTTGVYNSLVYAVNFDRQHKGFALLAPDALDPSFLATIPPEDWKFPNFRLYLSFKV